MPIYGQDRYAKDMLEHSEMLTKAGLRALIRELTERSNCSRRHLCEFSNIQMLTNKITEKLV
jgi:sensor c-di-GMP phosphodiesterase-like protein